MVFTLFIFVISFVLALIDGLLFGRQVLSLIFALATLVPSIGLGVRRLHDLGRPGWWYFGIFIPYVGAIALLVLFCLKGEDKDNAYGKKIA